MECYYFDCNEINLTQTWLRRRGRHEERKFLEDGEEGVRWHAHDDAHPKLALSKATVLELFASVRSTFGYPGAVRTTLLTQDESN